MDIRRRRYTPDPRYFNLADDEYEESRLQTPVCKTCGREKWHHDDRRGYYCHVCEKEKVNSNG